LRRQGHLASPRTVGRLLHAAGYSLQSNRKTQEGASHPDRNAQFEHINAAVRAFQQRGQPVISVDAKKKEAVGTFKNGGREWQPKGEPESVCMAKSCRASFHKRHRLLLLPPPSAVINSSLALR
jgi:hypothetical protein